MFTQIEGKCYFCDKSGHKLPQNRYKDSKPKGIWFINTVQDTQTNKLSSNDNDSNTSAKKKSSEYNSDSTITSKSSYKKIGWSNLRLNLSNCNSDQLNIMKDLVLLDSDSTNTIFCNKSYVNNIKDAEHPLEIQTNGGTMIADQTCEITYAGNHWFHKEAITNIISLADISKQYKVTMDTNKGKSMIVHLNEQKVKFYQ